MSCCGKRKKRGLVVFMTVRFGDPNGQDSITFRHRNNARSRRELMVNLSEEQQVTYTITDVKTRKGNPAEIDGNVSWAG